MAKKRIKPQNEKFEAKAKAKNVLVVTSLLVGIAGATVGGLAIANDYNHNKAEITVVENTPQYKKGFDDGQKSKDDQINALKDNLSELTLAKSTLELAREKDLNKIEELNGVIENNQTEIDSLTQEKNTAQEQVDSLTAEKTELQNQVDLLSQDKEANLEQINKLNSQIETKTNQINNLNNTITENETNISNLNAEIMNLYSEKDELNNQIASKNTQIENIQSQLTEVNSTITGLQNGELFVVTYHSPDGLTLTRSIVSSSATIKGCAPTVTVDDPETQKVRYSWVSNNGVSNIGNGLSSIRGNWDIYIEIVNIIPCNFICNGETITIRYYEDTIFNSLGDTPYTAINIPSGYEFVGWSPEENGEVVDIVGCKPTEFGTLYAILREKVENVASFRVFSNSQLTAYSTYAERNKTLITGNSTTTISATEPNSDTYYTQGIDDMFKTADGNYNYLPGSKVKVMYSIPTEYVNGFSSFGFTLFDQTFFVEKYSNTDWQETSFGQVRFDLIEYDSCARLICEAKIDKITTEYLQIDAVFNEKQYQLNVLDFNNAVPGLFFRIKEFSDTDFSEDPIWTFGSPYKELTNLETCWLGYFGRYEIFFNFEKQSSYVNSNSTIRLADISKSIYENSVTEDIVVTNSDSLNSIKFTNTGDDYAKIKINVVNV